MKKLLAYTVFFGGLMMNFANAEEVAVPGKNSILLYGWKQDRNAYADGYVKYLEERLLGPMTLPYLVDMYICQRKVE